MTLTADQISAIFAGIAVILVSLSKKQSAEGHATTQVQGNANHSETLETIAALTEKVEALEKAILPAIQIAATLAKPAQAPQSPPPPTPPPSQGGNAP